MPEITHCNDCSALEEELQHASEYYVGLIVQLDQMIRDGKRDDGAVEKAIAKARRRRAVAVQYLLRHRQTHEESSPKVMTAGQDAASE